MLLTPDSYGVTPAHLAASNHKMNTIPRHLLTERVLSAKDKQGNSPRSYGGFEDGPSID
jgi:hypothetical protein